MRSSYFGYPKKQTTSVTKRASQCAEAEGQELARHLRGPFLPLPFLASPPYLPTSCMGLGLLSSGSGLCLRSTRGAGYVVSSGSHSNCRRSHVGGRIVQE